MFLPHDLIKIRPRGVHTLTVYVLVLVKHVIKDLDSQMGHTDVIHVRETHGKPDVHSGRIFLHHVHLTADVAGGLLDTQEYLFWQC